MSSTHLQRSKIYEDVITVPATIAAATATWESDTMHSFESYAFGSAKAQVYVHDLSKVTDSFSVNLYVSFDEGTTWDLADTTSIIANGTGSAIDLLEADLAPRIKVELANAGAGELASEHGVKIDVQLEEMIIQEGERNFSFDESALYFAAGSGPAYSSVIECESVPYEVVMIATADDLSEVDNGTGGLAYVLESSLDGESYWGVTQTPKVDIANGTGELYSVTTESDLLGKYFRVRLYDTNAADDAELTEDADVRFALLTYK